MIYIKCSSAYRLTFFAMRCEFILAFNINYTTSSLNFNIAKCLYLTYCTWMCKNKQASEPSLSAEVDDQSPLAIYAHAGRVQGTYKNSQQQPSSPSCECGYVNIFFPHVLKNYSQSLPCRSASGGLPMPSLHKMAVSYTNVSLSSDCKSKCCHPPAPTGEWNT